jgi:hypothetical protein
MIALFVVRAESFHLSTCLATAALDNAVVHWSLLAGPYCVVTNVRNWSFKVLNAGIKNVALKYAVLSDVTSAQQETYTGLARAITSGLTPGRVSG